MTQAHVIKTCLDKFCSASSQRVNASKTKIFFSKNVNHTRINQICDDLGLTSTTDLGKYLGISLLHARVMKQTYNFILNKVQQRLSSWKAHCLNMAGRNVLITSVITALPSYAMQTMFLPAGVCDEVEKSARNFLWGSTNEKRKIHFMAWKDVCMPEENGRLGIRHLRGANQAFVMKNAWGLINRRDSLWVKILRSKYGCGDDVISLVKNRCNTSNLWRGICNLWDKFYEGLTGRTNHGTSTCFWKDHWVNGIESLESYACVSFSEKERNRKVCDFLSPSGIGFVIVLLYISLRMLLREFVV